jgi:Tfp pilus assembly protein PilF
MTETLFERYKEALRTGHVAVLRGRLEDAATAYREAISIAADRAVPRTALGRVLLRLGDPGGALEAFDGALVLEPDDDASLLGRAQALVVLRRTADAALAYDHLAGARTTIGRLAAAAEAARRALAIEPSDERRERHGSLADELRATARPAFDDAPAAPASTEPADPELPEMLGVDDAPAAPASTEPADPELPEMLGVDDAPAAPASTEPADPELPEMLGVDDAPAAPASTEPADPELPEMLGVDDAPTSTPEARPDPEALVVELEEAAARGDVEGAAAAALAAARGHRDEGRVAAAFDACLQGIGVRPGDVALHLMLADLAVDRGWTDQAGEAYRQLLRLADLDGDAAAAALVRQTAADRLPDDPRFAPG